MTITEWPSAAITRRVLNNSCASCGVRTAVGSSRMMTREPLLTAFMISTRCCSPIESCQIRAFGSTGMWSASAISSTCRTSSRRRAHEGLVAQGEGEIVGHRQRLDEAEVLMHHPDPGVDRVARRMELDGTARDLDLALVRPVEAR